MTQSETLVRKSKIRGDLELGYRTRYEHLYSFNEIRLMKLEELIDFVERMRDPQPFRVAQCQEYPHMLHLKDGFASHDVLCMVEDYQTVQSVLSEQQSKEDSVLLILKNSDADGNEDKSDIAVDWEDSGVIVDHYDSFRVIENHHDPILFQICLAASCRRSLPHIMAAIFGDYFHPKGGSINSDHPEPSANLGIRHSWSPATSSRISLMFIARCLERIWIEVLIHPLMLDHLKCLTRLFLDPLQNMERSYSVISRSLNVGL